MAEKQIPTRSSSQVEAAFYDDETQKMRVIFKSGKGAEYLYNNVDQETADAMADTPWNVMRDQLFDYERIS